MGFRRYEFHYQRQPAQLHSRCRSGSAQSHPERLVEPGGILQSGSRHVWKLRPQHPEGTVARERRCFGHQAVPDRRKKEPGVPHGDVQRSQPCDIVQSNQHKLGGRFGSGADIDFRSNHLDGEFHAPDPVRAEAKLLIWRGPVEPHGSDGGSSPWPARYSSPNSAGDHAGTAPAREATSAPRRLAKSPVLAALQPAARPCRNAAAKASPAPTVSATFTGYPGHSARSFPMRTRQPFSPRVMATEGAAPKSGNNSASSSFNFTAAARASSSRTSSGV